MVKPLPSHLTQRISMDLPDCKNLGLILDKYQPWEKIGNEPWEKRFRVQVRRGQRLQNRISKGNEAKGYWLTIGDPPRGVQWVDQPLFSSSRFDTDLYQENFSRWENLINSFSSHLIFKLTNRSRVVVGLGTKNTLEMGLALQYPYGFPWIPPSAMKGLARTRALFWIAENWGVPAVDNIQYLQYKEAKRKTPLQLLEDLFEAPIGKEEDPHRFDKLNQCLNALRSDVRDSQFLLDADAESISREQIFLLFRAIFGTQADIGKVIFLGGYTTKPPKLVNEIMTPHFKKYNEEGKYPRDNDSPEPITYLALESGQEFQFGIALRPGFDASKILRLPKDDAIRDYNQDFLKRVRAFTRLGLIDLGIGGKTNSGMGLFS